MVFRIHIDYFTIAFISSRTANSTRSDLGTKTDVYQVNGHTASDCLEDPTKEKYLKRKRRIEEDSDNFSYTSLNNALESLLAKKKKKTSCSTKRNDQKKN